MCVEVPGLWKHGTQLPEWVCEGLEAEDAGGLVGGAGYSTARAGRTAQRAGKQPGQKGRAPCHMAPVHRQEQPPSTEQDVEPQTQGVAPKQADKIKSEPHQH